MIETRRIKKIPFLYYVKDGICKSNEDMPSSAEGFRGWLCASHVIKNQERHDPVNVKSCLKALRDCVKNLKENTLTRQTLQDSELLTYI